MAKKNELNDLLNAMENESNLDLDMLQNYLGEYLKSYFLLGYDNDERSILMYNGKSDQDFHSLEYLVKKFSNINLNPQELLNNDEE